MSNQENTKKPVDEAVLRRLAEGRLKGLETRRKRAEIKKQEKAEAMNKLNKEYQEKVLKKKEPTEKSMQPIEETDKEIYPIKSVDTDTDDGDDEYEEPKPQSRKKIVQQQKQNYKQDYYKYKLDMLMQQQEQSNFMNQYSRLPPQQHLAEVAKHEIKQRVDKEVLQRVYRDLFG